MRENNNEINQNSDYQGGGLPGDAQSEKIGASARARARERERERESTRACAREKENRYGRGFNFHQFFFLS